jgi:hypothetical protein
MQLASRHTVVEWRTRVHQPGIQNVQHGKQQTKFSDKYYFVAKKNPEREDGICIFVFFFQIFGLLTGWNFTIIVLHSCVYVKYICTHFIILIKLFYIGVNALE